MGSTAHMTNEDKTAGRTYRNLARFCPAAANRRKCPAADFGILYRLSPKTTNASLRQAAWDVRALLRGWRRVARNARMRGKGWKGASDLLLNALQQLPLRDGCQSTGTAQVIYYGLMFWLMWKKLFGSYFRLISTSRS